jgi:hypothetical protein
MATQQQIDDEILAMAIATQMEMVYESENNGLELFRLFQLANAAKRRERQIRNNKTIYVVRYSNYDPDEIESIWDCKECAEQRATELGGMWEVGTIAIQPCKDTQHVTLSPRPHPALT